MWHNGDCPVRAHTRYTLTAPWLSMRTSTVSGPPSSSPMLASAVCACTQ